MDLNLDGPRVFLSYSHDSREHEAAVQDLAKRLRADGCRVLIDQDYPWVSPRVFSLGTTLPSGRTLLVGSRATCGSRTAHPGGCRNKREGARP